MCRIFGCFGRLLDYVEIAEVSRRQIDGGPDTQYFAHGATWSVGVNRLAIVNPEGGAQPFRLGRITVVYNGEIYNHHELRAELRARGHHVTDQCDGAVLPAMYAEYGPDFVDRLDGMYAIAVIDERGSPRMHLMTDHAGMKPLYWYWSDRERALYFSSELRGLFALAGVPMEFTDSGLDVFLGMKYCPGPGTMFREVSVLTPGQQLTLSGGRPTIRHRPPQTTRIAANTTTYSVLREGVSSLLRADVPACVVTSGGLDSSLVTALAAEMSSELHSFNIGYVGDWPGDERSFAASVAQHCGTHHHQVMLDPSEIPEIATTMALATGQPNGAAIAVSTYKLFEAIADAGFRVALTGDGSDEIFGGYRHTLEALTMSETTWWPGYMANLVSVPYAARSALYSSEYRDRIETSGPVENWLAAYPHSGTDRLSDLTQFELDAKFPYYHLTRVDHLSMAHSVEARLPFCQRDVIAYGRALPPERKISGDRGKVCLTEPTIGRLPDAVTKRPKQPFTLPLAHMMSRVSELTGFIESVLTDPIVDREGFLDRASIRQEIRRFREHPSTIGAQILWSLTVHQLWRNAFRSTFATCSAPIRDPANVPDSAPHTVDRGRSHANSDAR